jgi:hypothetical protein
LEDNRRQDRQHGQDGRERRDRRDRREGPAKAGPYDCFET